MKSIHSIRFWINHIRLLNLMSHVTFSGSKRSISKSKQQTVLIHTHSVLCYLYTEILPGNTLIHMFRIIKILVSGAAREFSVFKSLTKRCAINSAHKWLLRSNSHLKQSRDSCTTCSMILHHCYCNSSQFLFHSVVFRCLRPYRVWVTCWLWGQKGWVVSFCLCWMVFSCSSPFLSSTATLMELTWHLFLWWPLTPSAPPTWPQLWELFTFFTPSPTSSAHLWRSANFPLSI